MGTENRDSPYSNEPEGRYADRFRIGYRSCLFILDFDQSFYEDEKERVHTRIITSPEDLKSFLKLLQESIEQYEKNHGYISQDDEVAADPCG
jgi:hypothetical protein